MPTNPVAGDTIPVFRHIFTSPFSFISREFLEKKDLEFSLSPCARGLARFHTSSPQRALPPLPNPVPCKAFASFKALCLSVTILGYHPEERCHHAAPHEGPILQTLPADLMLGSERQCPTRPNFLIKNTKVVTYCSVGTVTETQGAFQGESLPNLHPTLARVPHWQDACWHRND